LFNAPANTQSQNGKFIWANLLAPEKSNNLIDKTTNNLIDKTPNLQQTIVRSAIPIDDNKNVDAKNVELKTRITNINFMT
jgi:hypothetical protein